MNSKKAVILLNWVSFNFLSLIRMFGSFHFLKWWKEMVVIHKTCKSWVKYVKSWFEGVLTLFLYFFIEGGSEIHDLDFWAYQDDLSASKTYEIYFISLISTLIFVLGHVELNIIACLEKIYQNSIWKRLDIEISP